MSAKIGLEIHIELSTKSKLFCSCSRISEQPNSSVCPTCLGMPGAKPVVNKKAIEYALKLALAVNATISKELIFSRKSYFYPDMAKNYQITQYEIPLATSGVLKLESGKKIRIKRIHLEEDPASLIHPLGVKESNYVLVDYNRSGNPLVELVTEPDFETAEEARYFMKKLITLLHYLEIFDINSCIIKADANISIKESGYVRVEIKNITGFKDIERALRYEIERQKSLVREGKEIKQETRGWDSNRGVTYTLREKETEADYGYIIDPDLVKIEITEEWVNKVKADLPELAEEKIEKFVKEHGIDIETAKIIAKDKKLAILFEKVAIAVNPLLAAKWVRRELKRVLNYHKKTLEEVSINEKHLIDLLHLIETNRITERTAQKILEELVEKAFDVKEYVKKHNLEIMSDLKELRKYCEEVIKENKKGVEDYKKGNLKAFHFLVGSVMKKTKGKANPKEVNRILKELLDS